MTWATVITVGGSLLGGLMSGDQGSQTQTREIDPRIAPYLFGGNGGGGLLNNVNNTMAQQYNQGGLNPLQNAGLELQRQTLMDPRYTQGFDQMRNLGAGLMGGGVAGNPFTGGGMVSGMPTPSFGANRLTGGMMHPGGAGGQVNLGTPAGRMSAQGFDRSSFGVPQPMAQMSPNLGFNSTTAPAFQQIMPQAPAPQAQMQPGDIQTLLDQQKKTQPAPFDDFRLSAGQ